MERPAVSWSARMAPIVFRALKTQVVPGRRPITYGGLASRVGTHPRPLRHALARIWDWYETNGHPHINVLVVSQDTGLPGIGYTPGGRVLTPRDVERLQQEAFRYDWTPVEMR